MLTIDTIPLNVNGQLTMESGKLFRTFSIIHCPFSIVICSLYAACGNGNGDRTY